MDSSNRLSDSKISIYTGRPTSSSTVALPQISLSCSESSLAGLIGNVESTEVSGHQPTRWAFDLFVEEQEQPFWLEDLLNEPDTRVQRGHRRSTSETFAYVGEAAQELDIKEDTSNQNINVSSNALPIRQNIGQYMDSDKIKFDIKPRSQDEKYKKDLSVTVSRPAEKYEEKEVSSQNLEESMEGTSSSLPKPSISKTEAKRAKQQSAHRSRARKLQYISQLERTIQLLQAEGSEISAELEFLDHQNHILSIQNKALKQQLDSLSQEQLIKQSKF
ncbi:hypothetical protein ACH5RR_033749 [Cinchona calisaya]|uniref:BZIP domain-containing protein n=1 Tax=Cinchona calisaya TaxID=153742 RepID=A0ABD2Y8V1_9GENT